MKQDATKSVQRRFGLNAGIGMITGVLAAAALLVGCGPADRPAAPPDALPVAAAPIPRTPFADVTDAAGLSFQYINGMSGRRYFVEMVGGGGALFDYDNDGDLDLYAVQGHHLDAAGPGAAPPTDRLYRNDLVETGTLRFTDVTAVAGLHAAGYGLGAATGDVDNDGFTDLYVLNWGPNQLWRNKGDGTFEEVTEAGSTDDPRWSTGAAFLDFDRDGWLDLVVINYEAYSLANDHSCRSVSGLHDYCGPEAYAPVADRLLRNRGDGTFEDVTLAMRFVSPPGPALGVVTADFNGDGFTDIYVANDGRDNQLWMNLSGRRFEDQAVQAGAAVNADGRAEASMGVVAEDFDGDGDEDLVMAHLNGETNTLYLNDGQALFEDRSRPAGLGLPSLLYTAFGLAPLDYDNDGWLDLFVANGEVRIIAEQHERGEPLPLRQPNQLFRNQGEGRFAETTPAADDVFSRAEVSRGVAYGDVDNDGDTDVVVFNNDGPLRLLRNEVGHRRLWLGLHLRSARRDALGARVALLRTGGTTHWRRVHTDGGYGAAHDPRLLFGLSNDGAYQAVHVYWPSGVVEAWTGLALNQYHRLVEGEGKAVAGS